MSRASCGLDLHCVPDVNKALEDASVNGYDFLSCPIVHPRFQRELLDGNGTKRKGPLTRSDLLLAAQDWSSLIVGKVSPWINPDSSCDVMRKNSIKALKQELVFAAHLSLPSVILKLRSKNCADLARILSEHLINGPNQQFWIQVPMISPKELIDPIFDVVTDEEQDDTWEWWHRFRTLCDLNKKVGVALELTSDLPSQEQIERWTGEPVKVVVIPTSLFLTNKKGFPVLSQAHQVALRQFFKLNVQMIVTGSCKHPERTLKTYFQYLDHLWLTQPPVDEVSQFAKGYEDYLQCPLQPLMDNLESGTYEVFEKDPIKYSQYQKAVYHALLDRIPAEEKDTSVQVLMVVGAGRGPLVRASLLAAEKAERKIRVYAVEKNPNAVVTLENRKIDEWGDMVTVVSCDMREWDAPEKADILVSELLGSFGDNELSPECLDGAQTFLKEDGISIPSQYTSYLAPMQSSRLYNEVRLCKEKDKGPEAPFEMPYVVRLHNVNVLDEPQPAFEFNHPNRGPIDNTRYVCLDFTVKENSVVHGFAGYFESVLYKDVNLSIVPATHSPGMFSWFPIVFPIRNPMYLKKGERLTVNFWRLVTTKNVWYEWCITEPRPTPVHNPKGRSYTIGL